MVWFLFFSLLLLCWLTPNLHHQRKRNSVAVSLLVDRIFENVQKKGYFLLLLLHLAKTPKSSFPADSCLDSLQIVRFLSQRSGQNNVNSLIGCTQSYTYDYSTFIKIDWFCGEIYFTEVSFGGTCMIYVGLNSGKETSDIDRGSLASLELSAIDRWAFAALQL